MFLVYVDALRNRIESILRVRLIFFFWSRLHSPVQYPYFKAKRQQKRTHERSRECKYIVLHGINIKYKARNDKQKQRHAREHTAEYNQQKSIIVKKIGEPGCEKKSQAI